MKNKWFSRLSAYVLAAALLLPCVLTVPVMAAEGNYDTLYSWSPSGGAYACAQELVNNAVPRSNYEAIQQPTSSNYNATAANSNRIITTNMTTKDGSFSKSFFSMYVGINAKGGLNTKVVTDGTNSRRKTTESLKVTLAELAKEPIGSASHKAIALTHLLAVRTADVTEHNMLRDDDAVYTVHTTAGRQWTVNGIRSWKLMGAGTLASDDTVFYQVTSNNLLAGYTLGTGEQIDRIDYWPYGLSTSIDRGGYFHISDVELRGYTDSTLFTEEFPDCHSYTSVDEATLRDIVVAEAKLVANTSWTTPSSPAPALLGYNSNAYSRGQARLGPIYQRGSSNQSDPLILLSTEAFLDMLENGTYVNRTFDNKTFAPGMDCSTFVYNAISRVSTTMAYTNMFYERDNSLVRLGNLESTDDQPKFTDGDVINNVNNTKAEVIAAYKLLKKGDTLNKFKLDSNSVHAMLVYETPTSNASSITVIDQSSGTSSSSNSKIRTISFTDLYNDKYLPYTLKEYTEGRVQNANVQMLVLPKNTSDWAQGVGTFAAASNYRILSMSATVTDSNNDEVFSFTEFGYRSRTEHQVMNMTDFNAKLVTLPAGSYTLTLAVTSGPKTSLGGGTPVKEFTQTFSVAASELDAHITAGSKVLTGTETTLTAGTWYLDENVVANNPITIGEGEVTLCLNNYALRAGDSVTDSFITVPAGAKLTICGGAEGLGTIRGCGVDNVYARGIFVNGGELVLDSGIITGFNADVVGAGVNVATSTGIFTMNGGSITNNTSTARGGGVNVASSSSQFIMNGGSITNNTAAEDGGGLRFAAGGAKITLNGGSITNNTAGTYGGGFYSRQSAGKLTMKNVTITGNTAPNGSDIGFGFTTSATGVSLPVGPGCVIGYVYLTNELGTSNYVPFMTVEDAEVQGVSVVSGKEAPGLLTITSGTFGFDPEGKTWVKLAANTKVVKSGDKWVVQELVSGACGHTGIPLTAGTSELTDGIYLLNGNITADANITVTGDATLCLCSYTLTAPASGGDFITVSEGASLSLCGGNGTIRSHESASADARGVSVSGTMVMERGTISGFNTTNSGGAIYVNTGAVCLIKDGTFSENSAANGGAICVDTSGTFTLQGGTFLNNTATNYGGAIRTASVCSITGGTFVNNMCGSNYTLFFDTATTISGVTIVTSGSIGNENIKIADGKFNVDPTSNLADTEPLIVTGIEAPVTINGQTHVLTKEVKPGLAASEGAHIRFGSSLDMGLYLQGENGVNGDGYTVTATKGEATLTVDEATTQLFLATKVPAKDMDEDITYKVTKDGVTYFETTLSVYDTLKGWYDDPANTIDKTLLADMLNYGNEAHRALKDAEHTYTALPGTTDTPTWLPDASSGVDEGYANKVAVSLSLKDNIQLNVYINDGKATVSNVTFKGASYDKYTTNKVYSTDGTKSVTRITFGGIDMVDAKDVVSFTVTLSDGQTFNVTTGIKEYVVSMVGGTQGAVIQALQKYVDSVIRVLGSNS